MKYLCQIIGTIIIEAENEDEAIMLAGEKKESEWDWGRIEVENETE